MTGRRCSGSTVSGNQCRRIAPPGELLCSTHNENATSERDQQKADVLEALTSVFGYAIAARAANISHVHLKWLRDEDPVFDASCDDARAAALDSIEGNLIRRARGFEHTEETKERMVVNDETGETDLVTVKTVTRFHYSDKAAELLLRGIRPQYRNNYDAPVPVAGPTETETAARRIFEDPILAARMDELLSDADRETT